MKAKGLCLTILSALTLFVGTQTADATLFRSVEYEITISTTTADDAGTDSNIDVILHGDKNGVYTKFGPFRFDDPDVNDEFERGQLDTMKVKSSDLGEITSIELISDGRGHKPGWLPGEITIDSSNGDHWYAIYDKDRGYIGEKGKDTRIINVKR